MLLLKLFLTVFLIHATQQLNNGLGLTPQMGWNSWNHFGCNINEDLIKQTADIIVSSGLAAAGYEYGWFNKFY
jgi:alpha-galactosidase